MVERRLIRISGVVQGVGFRPWAYRQARALGLGGSVSNDAGAVVLDLEGSPDKLDQFLGCLERNPPPLAEVREVAFSQLPPAGCTDFEVGGSLLDGKAAIAIPADVATCDPCLEEMSDPRDRRYNYPFINCTDCGPRFTIITAGPYDRTRTTMAGFPLCTDCAREYADPSDRRFHAEVIACPACGPQVRWRDPAGQARDPVGGAIAAAAAALRAGSVVAVKGVGGYHLAVDATNAGAVEELRRRKQRDEKPFAVMVADLSSARALAVLDEDAREALVSPARPVVIVPLRPGGPLAAACQPGLSEVGLLIAYSGLHHLLLAEVGGPLVMTSGNLTDEPIAHRDAEAVDRLGPMVEGLLTHDRPIHAPCDDSVTRAGRSMVRRSRGHAPRPFSLPVAGPDLLAVGAHLKNTVAVARGGLVVASQHLGDLDHPAAARNFAAAVDHLLGLSGVNPQLVAHDLHPGYRSTQFAVDLDLPLEPVQHHHAHVASCLADHGRRGPVLGVAFDGLGLGDDGGLWGGEFLVADLRTARRVGHLRAVPLPGGDAAARQPWRMLAAWVDAVAGRDAARDLAADAPEDWLPILDLLDDAALTTSAGRLFDAVAALAGLRRVSSYEGQAAVLLEAAAATGEGLEVDGCGLTRAGEELVLDPGPLLVSLLAARQAGAPAADVASTFHDRLAAGITAAVTDLAERFDTEAVVLSGGVFQNLRLSDQVAAGVQAVGLECLRHRQVPPNDAGISIGQAAVASARHG